MTDGAVKPHPDALAQRPDREQTQAHATMCSCIHMFNEAHHETSHATTNVMQELFITLQMM